MILALFLAPAAAAVLAIPLRSASARRCLLAGTAIVHAALVAWRWLDAGSFGPVGDWLALDEAGLLVLTVASVLFAASAVATIASFGGKTGAAGTAGGAAARRAIVLASCLPGFLATMTLVCLSRHAGLLWVAVEATTLVSAPLVGLHGGARALEATWKYLLVCSVGIAIALLGTYFLAAAASPVDGAAVPLAFPRLIASAPRLDPRWLKAAFLLAMVGYGTKMGLVPFHTWLPDAHSEAPSAVSALLSGALLNCAFLGVLRFAGVCDAAGLGPFARETLVQVGLLSMVVAAALLLGQADYKRLLAWSSVEHMGILAVGIGLGGAGSWGALFHAASHSLVKAALFLAAGNILTAWGTTRVAEVRGVLRAAPVTGAVWVLGLFAITGAPPFGTFVGELAILRSAAEQGSWVVVAVYLLALVAAFVGMASAMLRMAQGTAGAAGPRADVPRVEPRGADSSGAPTPSFAAPRTPLVVQLAPGVLLCAAFALGVFAPEGIVRLIDAALGALHL